MFALTTRTRISQHHGQQQGASQQGHCPAKHELVRLLVFGVQYDVVQVIDHSWVSHVPLWKRFLLLVKQYNTYERITFMLQLNETCSHFFILWQKVNELFVSYFGYYLQTTRPFSRRFITHIIETMMMTMMIIIIITL